MKADMTFDTREFERAMQEVSNESDRTDYEIVTANARTLLRSVVYNAPRDTGSLRAGFWPAWEALKMAGSPGTRRRYAPYQRKSKSGKTRTKRVEGSQGRTYYPTGGYSDDRQKKGEAAFEFVNATYLIDERGKKRNYPVILNRQTGFMGEGEAEAAYKFGKGYEKLLRKHGKL